MNSINETVFSIPEIPLELNEENLKILSKPFIVKGYLNDCLAFEKWSYDFFIKHCGSNYLTVTSDNEEQIKMTVEEYMQYIQSEKKDGNYYYLKDWEFEKDFPELRNDYKVPTLFDSWTDILPLELKPNLRWLYIGVKGSGSPLHIDLFHTNAWNGVLKGEKHWTFFHPDDIKYLYDLQVDTFNPDYDKFPLYKLAKPITCVQKPGDLVYTPGGWPHQVKNMESGISVTENFVNELNYSEVKDYLVKNGEEEILGMLELLKEKVSVK